MSALAKSAREKMKAKARSLASEKDMKVDSSDWTPAEPLNADVKTGARPISKRQFKKGGKVVGKVDGKATKMRADRKPRKSGGRVESEKAEAKEYANAKINRDVRAANEEREGKKHIGGFKKGGAPKADGKRAKKQGGGFLENLGNALAGRGYIDGSTFETPKDRATEEPMDITPALRKAPAPARAPMARRSKPRIERESPEIAREYAVREKYPYIDESIAGTEVPMQSARFLKKGGKAKRKDGGSVPSKAETRDDRERLGSMKIKPVRGAAQHYKHGGKLKRAEGGETTSGLDASDPRMSIVKPKLLSFGQNTVVPGQKKGGKVEGKMLSAKDNKKQKDTAKRMNRATGGMVDIGAMKKGPKSGKKGKTNINIVINAGKRDQEMPMDMGALPPPPPAGIPVPMNMPPAGGMPPGAPPMGGMGMAPPMMPPAPPAPPPAAPQPAAPQGGMPPMPRKRGGRVAKQTGGAMGFKGAQTGGMPAGAAPDPRLAALFGNRAPAPAPMPAQAPMPAPMPNAAPAAPINFGGAADALRFEPAGQMQRFVPGAPVNIAGPGIRPVQNLEINRSATTYPTRELLTPEQMAMMPTQNIPLQEALRLFLKPQQAAQQAAQIAQQRETAPQQPAMQPEVRQAEQSRIIQQAQESERARIAAEKDAAARAEAERLAAEQRQKAPTQPTAPSQFSNLPPTLAEKMAILQRESADRAAAQKAALDKALSDRAAAQQAAAQQAAAAQKAAAERAAAQRAAAEKALAERTAAQQAAQKAAADQAAAQRAAAEKALAERTAAQQAAQKAAAERAAAQRAAAEKALAGRTAAQQAAQKAAAQQAAAAQKAAADQAAAQRAAAEKYLADRASTQKAAAEKAAATQKAMIDNIRSQLKLPTARKAGGKVKKRRVK